jgi:hypothetical protein
VGVVLVPDGILKKLEAMHTLIIIIMILIIPLGFGFGKLATM